MPDVTKLRAGDPGDLVQLVPYLLGFRPAESLVLVCLRGTRVACTVRVDLDRLVDVEDVDVLLQRLRASTRLDALAAVFYTADGDAAARATALVESALGELEMIDEIWVHDGCWESFAWGGTGRCMEAGELAAEAVYAGLSAAPDRGSVVDVLEPQAGAAESRELRASVAARVRRWGKARRIRELRSATRREPTAVDPATAALVAELVSDGEVRDSVSLSITGANAAAQLAFWIQVVRLLPDDSYAVAPLGLVGLCAWQAGEGTLMSGALQRGDRIGVEGGLLALLGQINELALPPQWWEVVRSEAA